MSSVVPGVYELNACLERTTRSRWWKPEIEDSRVEKVGSGLFMVNSLAVTQAITGFIRDVSVGTRHSSVPDRDVVI